MVVYQQLGMWVRVLTACACVCAAYAAAKMQGWCLYCVRLCGTRVMLLAVYGTGVASAGATSRRLLTAGKEPGRCTLCIRSCNAGSNGFRQFVSLDVCR